MSFAEIRASLEQGKRYRAEQLARARGTGPVELRHTRDPGKFILVQPRLDQRTGWSGTVYDADGPIWGTTFSDRTQALISALGGMGDGLPPLGGEEYEVAHLIGGAV